MFFWLPRLDARMFAGNGITLRMIGNPNLPPVATDRQGKITDFDSFYRRLQWVDAVTASTFTIRAPNAEATLPIVFRDCAHLN